MVKCLVVDDVEVTLFATKKALDSIGVEHGCVQTREEALSALRRERYDVILLDWHLGKNSGLDLLKEIRKEHGSKFKIIVFSGVEAENKSAEARSAGADTFLEKPTTAEKIKKSFQELRLL